MLIVDRIGHSRRRENRTNATHRTDGSAERLLGQCRGLRTCRAGARRSDSATCFILLHWTVLAHFENTEKLTVRFYVDVALLWGVATSFFLKRWENGGCFGRSKNGKEQMLMCKLLVYSQIRNAKRFRISIVAVLNWLQLFWRKCHCSRRVGDRRSYFCRDLL